MFSKVKSAPEKNRPKLVDAIRWSNRTNRNRIVALGLVICLCYLPTWLRFIGVALAKGSSFPILNLGFLFFGIQALLQYRKSADSLELLPEDQLLASLAVIMGGVVFFVSLDSASFQSLGCAIAVAGMLFLSLGWGLFSSYPLKLTLLFTSIYPDLTYILNQIRVWTTGEFMERVAASLGSLGLNLLGQSSSVDGILVFLGEGSVKVASGCSGFDMAVPIAGFAFMLGLFFHLKWTKTLLLIIVGVALALLLNIPRIMVLANAAVYWGEDSFYFWHDSWGAQVFSGILFTIYYYVAMPIIGDQVTAPE